MDSRETAFSFLEYELAAFGNTFTAEETGNGFLITHQDAAEEPISLRIFVYGGSVGTENAKIICVGTPLFYELRTVEQITDSERKDIRKALRAAMKDAAKKPKKAAKAPAEPEPNQWVQPSLFDL